MKFNIGDILINKKREENNIIFHYVIVGSDDTYTYIKRLDTPYEHKPARYPTHNMSWFFEIVSSAQ
jgi:hypothetical protein